MKSIREALMFTTILNLIQDRSYEILCDIVDAVLFNTGTLQTVFNKWGIKLNVDQVLPENSITVFCRGGKHGFTIAQYETVMTHLRYDRFVEAIKAVRAATNYGLKEAKDLTEFLRNNRN